MRNIRTLFCAFLLVSAAGTAAEETVNLYRGEGIEVNMLSDYDAGVKRAQAGDHEMATKFFKQGAEKGDPRAMFALGTQYYFGEGAAQDFSLARKWLEAGTEKGSGPSAYVLSVMYTRGEGVEPNAKRAMELLRMAAMACVSQAQLDLSRRLFEGNGVDANQVESVAWLLLAADADEDGGAETRELVDQIKEGFSKSERERLAMLEGELRAGQMCAE